MQVHVPWLHNCYITFQVYDAVSEATSSIGEIIKSLCTSNKERHHDSLSTIQSLLQVCTYIVCNGKNKSLLKKETVSIQYINYYADVHLFKIISPVYSFITAAVLDVLITGILNTSYSIYMYDIVIHNWTASGISRLHT